MKTCSPLLSTLIIPLVAVSPLMGQMQPSRQAADVISAPMLQLRIVESEPSSSPVSSSSPKDITVEVTDDGGSRVANATVTFRLPETGGSARFRDGAHSAIVSTDIAGRASVSDIQWGDTPGKVALRITAAKGTLHAGLLFEQTVAPAPIPAAPAPSRAVSALPVDVQPQAIPKPQLVTDEVAVPSTTPRVTIERINSPRSSPAHAALPRPVPENDNNSSEPPSGPARNIPSINADDIDANVPLRHLLATGAETGQSPSFSITSARNAPSGHSRKKWLIGLAVAAGAGAALAVVKEGKSGTSTASGVSIGAPTISVGHP